MSSSRLVGLILALIGYLSGAILVAQPFVPQIEASLPALAVLFPLCLVLGLPLYAVGDNRAPALRASAWGLLAIGLAGLLGLFADATGLLRANQTVVFWLLAPACLVFGLLLASLAAALDRVNRERAARNVNAA